ncbi:MAG: ABC transporter permease subunit [Gammaproteobacteria bacterium]|nr:ABC transporter permease subunit [Gammaproteobacteria bacterium]
MKLRIWHSYQIATWQPNLWDVVAVLLLFLAFAFLSWGATQMTAPYQMGEALAVNLSPSALPYYILRTILRMLIAMFFALFFTFTLATLAAKNKHARHVIIPIIDILQSVPVLGFLSITIVGFISLFPNSLLGPECAAIFAIFTCQAWNIFLGFYQSLRTVPPLFEETAHVFQLSPWQKFWRLEVPFALPSLIWNMMISMSTSWFFVVASEAITVNKEKILLPGIGSYIGVAIMHQDIAAIVYAIIAMIIVILLYDQLVFRPLVNWSEKFKSGENEEPQTQSWILRFLHRTRLLKLIGELFAILFDEFVNLSFFQRKKSRKTISLDIPPFILKFIVYLWYFVIITLSLLGFILLMHFIYQTTSLTEILHVFTLGFYTTLRIMAVVIVCSVIWVPIGIWVGLRPRTAHYVQAIAQLFSAFPMNLLFPLVVIWILKYKLNFEIWCAPLMILGPQWYMLFNIIAGTSTIPQNLRHAAKNFGVTGFLWFRRFIFPVVFPYFITGAITTVGGAWNATIVAEIVNWGTTSLKASGLGSYITQVTAQGSFAKVALGLGVMCLYVLFFDHLVWQPLYNLAAKRT